MVICKFGGTSVRDDVWIDKALNITIDQLNEAPIMVASAMAKVTDKLQEIALFAAKGKEEEANQKFEEIKTHHLKVAKNFLTGQNLEKCNATLESLFNELESIVKGLSLLRECSDRSNDTILAFGERLSTTVIYYRGLERGINTILVDARDVIKTDDHFRSANLLTDISYHLINQIFQPAKNTMYVTQGFIGSTEDGITSTLGRGGSDYTAAIIGAALNVSEIQIWTDVDGIMTSDPRIVEKAVSIPVITYQEAAELAYFGAKVIHPSTIQPAISKGIPVVVKNTGNPGFDGTRIVADKTGSGPKAIAFKKGITIINISSYRMLLAYGFLRKIFEVFEKFKTPVDLIATSEVSVSITIDNPEYVKQISQELKNIASITTVPNNCIVSIVGQDLWKNSAFISQVFTTLQSIPVRMISMGASDTNFSFVLPESDTERAVKNLHADFFK